MLSKKYTAEELKKLSVEELQRISNDLNLEVGNNKKLQTGGSPKRQPQSISVKKSQPVKLDIDLNFYYVKYKTRLTLQQLNKEKSKHGLISIKHATKRTDLIPSAANVVVVEGGNINKIKQDPNVVFVEPVPVDTEDQITDDPLYYDGDNASQTTIRVNLSHEDALEEFGFGVYYPMIGQIEGQWRYEHPDISNVTELNEGSSADYSQASHALAVASVMVSDSNNGIGMMGLCPNCSLAFVNTWAIGVSLPEALEIHLEQGTKVVNYSVGSGNYSQTHQDAINDAYGNGLLLVCSAGNNSTDNDVSHHYPSDYDNTLSVGANSLYNYDSSCTGQVPGPCDNIDVTSYMSMTAAQGSGVGAGSCMDLYGNDVDPWGDECWFRGNTGTSFSAPVVTGLIGLLLSHNPDLTPAQMYEIVTSTNIHPAYGQRPGIIDFREALSYMYNNYGGEGGEIEYPTGDLNEDFQVNVQDVVLLIDTILYGCDGGECTGGIDVNDYPQYASYDITGDGIINILDVVTLIQMVLNNPQTTSAERQQLEDQLSRLSGLQRTSKLTGRMQRGGRTTTNSRFSGRSQTNSKGKSKKK